MSLEEGSVKCSMGKNVCVCVCLIATAPMGELPGKIITACANRH